MTSSGMYGLARCQSCACGTTSASAKRRISVANGREGLVEAGVADRALVRLGDQRGEARARLGRVSRLDQRLDRFVAPSRDVFPRQAEIAQADDFALVHRDAAENLGEIFAQADAGQQRLGLAEAAFGAHSARVGGHFLDRLDIGGEPGEPVRGVLFALDFLRAEAPADRRPFRARPTRRARATLRRRSRLVGRDRRAALRFLLLRRCCAAQCFALADVAMRFWGNGAVPRANPKRGVI